jgi:hypothetical protein
VLIKDVAENGAANQKSHDVMILCIDQVMPGQHPLRYVSYIATTTLGRFERRLQLEGLLGCFARPVGPAPDRDIEELHYAEYLLPCSLSCDPG